MPSQDHIELLIIRADGTRFRFVGQGEMTIVDNIEPDHLQMMVVAYFAPILDPITQTETAKLRIGEVVSTYSLLRHQRHDGWWRVIAAGEYRGYWIAEAAIERILPETKPSLSLTEDADGEVSAAPG